MNNGATIITKDELRKLPRRLPESLYRAAGLLRHKKKALHNHLNKVRAEWDRKHNHK